MAHDNYVGFVTESGRRVHAALSSPRFNFRTLAGLAKESKLHQGDVRLLLMAAVLDHVVEQTQNGQGIPIYCLAESSVSGYPTA